MSLFIGDTPAAYFSYLLRIWQVPANGEGSWRILLENIQTGEKRGFTSLEELSAYLQQSVKLKINPSGEGNHVDVQG